MEIWREIPGYSGIYEASNYGRIRTVDGKTTSSARFPKRVWKQRIIKQKVRNGKNGRKDFMVTLWKERKPYSHLVARLIAATFIKNNLNTTLTVNHKDGNPLNNHAENLEWLTKKQNIQYGFKTGQYSRIMKPITATNRDSEFDTIFATSYFEMDRQLNQYHGYTSRMIGLKSDYLISKSGKRYEIEPF